MIAIDLDRKGIWERLIRETRSSPGTLIFPLKKKQSREWCGSFVAVWGYGDGGYMCACIEAEERESVII